MRITFYLIYFFFFPFLLFSQTPETEPNDICNDVNIITISSFGDFTGDLDGHSGSDFTDYWYLQAGSSGMVKFELSLGFGSDSYFDIFCYSGNFCGTVESQTLNVLAGTPTTISLNASFYYAVKVNGNDFDGASYTLTLTDMGGSLPVELTAFSGNISENKVQLSWQTATEVNNYGFEIERALTSLSTIPEFIPSGEERWENRTSMELSASWEKVGFVEGHGNSNSTKIYSFTDNSISVTGRYYYRLTQIDIDGQTEYSDIVEIDISPPLEYRLKQNYPNPFNPSTTISYSIPEKTEVNLLVYNIFGEEVKRIVNVTKEAGSYSVKFNAENIASGIYFYSIETKNYISTRKFILLK